MCKRKYKSRNKMLLQIFTCLLIGISTVRSAPVDAAQQNLQENLKEALSPVEEQVRAMIDTAKLALTDVSSGAVDEAEKIINSGKELVASANKEDRLNLGLGQVTNRLQTFQHALQDSQKSLVERFAHDITPSAIHAKSAFLNANDAMRLLETKYLTPDGQDLVKQLYKLSSG